MPVPGRYLTKHAKIDTATSGDNEIVAAVTGKRIVVLSYLAFNSGIAAIDVKFRSGTTDLMGILKLAASGGVSFAASSLAAPAFETAAGVALNLNLSAATQVSGHVTYAEV